VTISPQMRHGAITAIKALVTTLVLTDLCALAIWYHLFVQPYMAAALMGSFLLHASSGPRKRQLAGIFLLAAAFAVAYGSVRHESLLSIYSAAFLGIGSLAAQSLALIWGAPEQRARTRSWLLVGTVFPVFLFCTGIALAMLDQMNSLTYDRYLYVFDSSLGFSGSFAVGQLLAAWQPLRVVCYYAYEFLPLGMSIAFLLDRKRPARGSPSLLTLFITVAVSGYVLYHLYPAVGPVYVWPAQFPWSPLPLAAVPLEKIWVADGARNALPSLHMAMALVIWFVSRSWRLGWRIASGMLVALTVLATLGFGEHYVIDLVVAVPLVVAAIAWSTPNVPLRAPERWKPLVGGALLTLAWIVLLRVAVPVVAQRPALSWLLIVITVGVPWLWETKLADHAATLACGAGRVAMPDPDPRQPYGLVGATE